MHKILFIGGAGFIGSAIIHCMLKNQNSKDFEIHVLEPMNANLSRIDTLNVTMHKGKLSDIDLVTNIINEKGINIVVHLVSTIIPNSNYDDYEKEIVNIVFPTLRLSQFCSAQNVKFIYFSSGGTVYGNRKSQDSFKENDERNPISYYGLTKLMLENNILFEHRKNNLQYLIIRPSNPYGPGQSLKGQQGFIAVALGKILSDVPVEIFGNGSSIRDYIFIEDLANIFIEIIKKGVTNEIINIGSGIGYDLNQILQVLKSIVKETIKFEFKEAREVDVSSVILNIRRQKEIYDKELTSLEQGISKFYSFAQNKA